MENVRQVLLSTPFDTSQARADGPIMEWKRRHQKLSEQSEELRSSLFHAVVLTSKKASKSVQSNAPLWSTSWSVAVDLDLFPTCGTKTQHNSVTKKVAVMKKSAGSDCNGQICFCKRSGRLLQGNSARGSSPQALEWSPEVGSVRIRRAKATAKGQMLSAPPPLPPGTSLLILAVTFEFKKIPSMTSILTAAVTKTKPA